MSLTCGLVGLSGCGKTTIFNAITAAGAASFDGSEMHRAIVNVPDSRVDALAEMYHPARIIYATLKLVDVIGLEGGSTAKTGRASRLLQHVKDVDALLHVVRCFEMESLSSSGGDIDPAGDIETVDLDLVIADSQTLQNKIDRLAKKVKAHEAEAMHQITDCEKIKAGLDQGIPVRNQELNEKGLESISECNLVSLKPVLYIANIKSMDDVESENVQSLQKIADAENTEMITVCGRDEAEISQLDSADREEFLLELGLKESSMARLLQAAYRKLGLINFFTVGEDEVRAWTCRQGDKAPVAAGKVHTDMEKGFIRMQVSRCTDLLEHGSESALVKLGKQRVEGKTYEVREGDVVSVFFNPA